MTPIPYTLYTDLLGKPFARDARGPHAFDCVGLAIEIQRRRGASLPAYLSHPEELHRQLAMGGALDEAHRLQGPEPGCFVLLRGFCKDERHLGVMLDAAWMLHASEAANGVVRESLNHSLWGRRVLGFYRIGSLPGVAS